MTQYAKVIIMKKYKYKQSFTYEGQRYWVRADTKTELAVKIELKKRDLKEGKVAVNGSMLVSDWITYCIETYKTNQNETTRKKYENRISHNITEHIGSLQVSKVKPVHCQKIMNMLSGKSRTHVNEIYQALKLIIKQAKVNNLIAVDPTEALTKPRTKKPKSYRALTPVERQAVITVGKTDRRFYLYLLMLFCGCRPSEAAECMGKDIQKIGGRNFLHIRGTKTDFSDRFVPLPKELYSLVKSTPKDEYIALFSSDIKGTYSRTGPRKIDENNRSRLWASFKRQLNIELGCKVERNALIPPLPLAPDLAPYCLRHEYCTDLARRGIDIRHAQKLMGHSNISLTANIYTNLTDDDILDIADILDDENEKKAPSKTAAK